MWTGFIWLGMVINLGFYKVLGFSSSFVLCLGSHFIPVRHRLEKLQLYVMVLQLLA